MSTQDLAERIATIQADVRALQVDAGQPNGTTCYLRITEDEARDLASGYTPQSVIAMARLMLSENNGSRDSQRAERPVKPRKKRA